MENKEEKKETDLENNLEENKVENENKEEDDIDSETPIQPEIKQPEIEDQTKKNEEEKEDKKEEEEVDSDTPIEPDIQKPKIEEFKTNIGQNEEEKKAQEKEEIKSSDDNNLPVEENKEKVENEKEEEKEEEKEKEEQSHESEKNISNEDEFNKDEIELNNQSSGTNKNISKDSNIDFTNHKNFQNIKILYKYKLKNLRNIDFLKIQYENFWKLVPHNFEGEITKKDFLNLFTKIYKLLLPIFNYEEIEKFLLGEWALQTKGKSTMDHEIFNKCIFKISHLFCVHIEKNEYEDFLKMIYKRITKKIKYFPDKTKVEYKPSIKVHLYKEITKEEYDEKTWEQYEDENIYHVKLYETYDNPNENDENNENEQRIRARPRLAINEQNLYKQDKNFYLYDEETFYEQENELETINELNTTVETVLLNDDEIVIFGYPTQFIINKFINDMNCLENIETNNESDFDSKFNITDFSLYENQKFYLKIDDKNNLKEFLENNNNFILIRDFLLLNPGFSLDPDFSNDELNIVNNLRRNITFDRYVEIHEIKLPDESIIKANLDNLIIKSTYKKAFGNVFDKDSKKIGKKSDLWSNTIETKLELIYETKFYLIHTKLLNLNLSYSYLEPIIEEIKNELSKKITNHLNEEKFDLDFFEKFKSKERIIFDNWDSDNDLYLEANKKSPVVLIVGPPRIGKTSIANKLSSDLQMEFLEPSKFFESIFKKVEEFEEKMQNWEEENPNKEENENGEEGENAEDEEKKEENEKAKKKKDKNKKDENPYLASLEPEPKKNVKPGLDTVLNELELAIYNDLTHGEGISEQNMQRLYTYLLHNDLAQSRGIVIDMMSNIFPKKDDFNNDSRSFIEKLFTGFYGKVKVDYIIDLNMDKDELYERNKNIKLNIKTLKNISQREIELMKKPKVTKKEILEDEIEYDEEGKQIVPEPEPEPELNEEDLEKIPKENELFEITNNEQIFNEQLDYFENIQYPLIKEYANKLKKSYYIKIDVTGLDYDDVSNLIIKQLNFAYPVLRPIAKALEPGDYKGLLQDGREGILPYRKWSPWKQIDPVALKDDFVIYNGNPEFAATYFGRVFVFINEENRKKFLNNPKKYLNVPPQVPNNYRISIVGPSKSGKKTIAKILNELYGWKIIDMEEIFENVKEYQKNWTEPELNSVYSLKVHFSQSEFKEVLANMSKKPSDRKPDNFVSKIVFMCDYLGIPLDKKKTKEQFFHLRKYHENKLNHLFNRIEEAENRVLDEKRDLAQSKLDELIENKRLEAEEEEENKIFPEMTEAARCSYEVDKDKRHQKYIDMVNEKNKLKEEKLKMIEEKEKRNPYPPEEEYVIEDLKSDQFYLRFNPDGSLPRVNGIILLNHPFSEDETVKLNDFNILMDKIIYIKDETDEGIKALIERRLPNFSNLDEEKQNAEIEKVKTEQGKFDEVVNILKEKYNQNNEENIIEIGYNENLDLLKTKLENSLNPFNIKIDNEERIIQSADINVEEKFPLSRGPFGLFCPVVYKEENWLFYAPEANEIQVNQRIYRISGEKEMEKFRNNPSEYLQNNGSIMPVEIPPPHIMVTGYQGSGVTFFTNILSKQFKLKKREIQNEFMEIWTKQKNERKQKRIEKKIEELNKQNAEIQEKNEEAKKENPEAEPEPLINIEEAIKEDAGLDEEGEDYNATDNDKEIFKSLFNPQTPSIYDAEWNNMEEKVQMPFIDLLYESRRTPNVMIVLKTSMKSVNERLFKMEEIDAMYEKLVKESNDKRQAREDEILKQRQQEKYDELKAEYDAAMEQLAQEEAERKAAEEEKKQKEEEENKENSKIENKEENKNENNNEEEKKENEEEEEEEEDEFNENKNENKEEENENAEEKENNEEEEKKKKKKKKKLVAPRLELIDVELTPEEIEDIWKSPDPDLIEKEALIQQERDKITQRYENNVNNMQAFIDALKEKGIPVIEINNDSTKENVYKNILLELEPYINNRVNLIEKQLVNNRDFPTPLSLRKVRELMTNAEVYQQSVYGYLSPVNPSKLSIRTDYPLVYRDRVYLFNSPEERKTFSEYPLNYRTGLECPKDSYPMRGRTIIFTIGNMCSGKSTISKMMEEYMGYKRITVKRATLDLINMLKDCNLKKKIIDILYSGNATDDNLIIEILNRRITMEDLINENVVIDGFPYTLTQANLITENLIPNLIFVAQCEIEENLKRCLSQKLFKGIPEVVNERNLMLKTHLIDILEVIKSNLYDIRYFDMTKSKWYIKEQISNLLENRKKYEMKFARNYSLDKPCQLTYMTPKKLLNSILYSSHNKCNFLVYSTVALKGNHLFKNNCYIDNSFNNHIVYTPERELTQYELDQIEDEEERKNEELNLIKLEEDKKKLKEEKIRKKKEEEERLDKEIENPEIVYNEKINKENNENNEENHDINNLDENNINHINENPYNIENSNRKPLLTTESENEKEMEKIITEKLQTDNENDFDKPFITKFHFLTNDEEVEQFNKDVEGYKNYLIDMSKEILPPKILKPEGIAEVMYVDQENEEEEEQNEESEDNNEKESKEISEEEIEPKFSLNIHYEYQECCPVTIVEDKLMRLGKNAYSIRYCNKYYKFLSMDKMMKFKINPNRYINLQLPVKKVNEEENELLNDKQISFENTVNFLEFTFGSLITKGMLELSNNRIKYPYLNVKESSLKYLALYLKANNPNNNEYAKKKYKEILREFLKNSKLPFELFNVYDNYNKEKENPLHKQLIRKQLDNVSNKYDELMEKAKIQNNTRFANFFKRNVEK